jgi:hypothetical protein
MNDFGSALRPYDLTKAFAADRGDDCIVIDVGRNEHGQSVCSLKHVLEQVEQHVTHTRLTPCAASKLYITGEWVLTECDEANLDSQTRELKVSDCCTSIA